jgi:hypothetical protein
MSTTTCFFCGSKKIDSIQRNDASLHYNCKRCGSIKLSEDALDSISLSQEEIHRLRIILRNASFLRNDKPPEKPFSTQDLKTFLSLYNPLDPLEKMDHALFILDRLNKKTGEKLPILIQNDVFLFHCSEPSELYAILMYLIEQGDINAKDPLNPQATWIAPASGAKAARSTSAAPLVFRINPYLR